MRNEKKQANLIQQNHNFHELYTHKTIAREGKDYLAVLILKKKEVK